MGKVERVTALAQAPSERVVAGERDARIEWYRGEATFDRLAEPWGRLADAQHAPFGRPEWYRAWWTGFGHGELAVTTVWRESELVALMPWSASGRTLTALTNSETPFAPLLAAGGEEDMAMLLNAARGTAPRLVLGAVVAGADAGLVGRAAARSGLLTLERNAHLSPVAETTGNLDAWRKATKRRWQSPLERYRRKLARDLGATFRYADPIEDLEGELAAGFRLEAAGWKGERGSAVLASPAMHTFYSEVARGFQARGTLRVSSIDIAGRPVAWELGVLEENRLWSLKGAYDEALRKFSPGLVLRLGMIEHCFERHLDAYEIAGGDEPWKRKFSTSERRHVDIELYRRAPVPAVLWAARRSAQAGVRTWRSRRA